MSTGVRAKHLTQGDFAGTVSCMQAGIQRGCSNLELYIVGIMATLSILFLHDPTPNGHLHSANVTRVMNETGLEEHQTNKVDLDIVLAVYDENPQTILNHLEGCCNSSSCRVYIYSSMAPGTSRSHELERRKREKHDLEEWLAVNTSFSKFGGRVNNTWTGTEATAFLWHISDQYDNHAAKSAFMHAHITAWHSDRMCDIIRRGLGQLSGNVTGPAYVNLNKPYPRRCLSPNAFTGVHTSEELRNNVFTNWTNWFESSPPRRITYECCAQFITTRASLRGRPHTFWTRALRSMASPEYKIPWEYLWPTLIDETGSEKKANC